MNAYAPTKEMIQARRRERNSALGQICALEARLKKAEALASEKIARIIELENEIAELLITEQVLNARIVEYERDAAEVHMAQQDLRERGFLR